MLRQGCVAISNLHNTGMIHGTPHQMAQGELTTTDSHTELQQFIDTELQAISEGRLRSQQQIESFYQLLPDGTSHQMALSEKLGLGLLVERRELESTPSLVIQIAPDLSTLRYGELKEELSREDLNPNARSGRLFSQNLHINWLATIENPKLITPGLDSLVRHATREQGDRVLQMIGFNERLTLFGDLPATWNGGLDSKVWSTNIDTVHFIKWLRDLNVFAGTIKRSAEIGVGIGGISQALLADNSEIEQHIITDISPYAINATRRNLRPFINDQNLTWYLGKGVRTLGEQGAFDLIITNPPYIPHPQGHEAVDPYRGTGLIRELFEVGPSLLNPENPAAAIYIQISNLSLQDVARYQEEFPDVEVTMVGGPVEVPLKIWGVSREDDWIEYLKGQGLIESPERAAETGLRFYHEISAIKLTRKQIITPHE